MDKMWWNEQFMGYPVGPQYAACSNVENAGKLKGKLLLLVGELDDNVDPASTMQVVNALIKADKDFELLVLPGMKHTGGGTYGERKRRDFFVKNLLGLQPPDWNSIEPKEKPNHSTK
jgi:dipeptidyl aminopeptidase/acylaminoacyl peptidase